MVSAGRKVSQFSVVSSMNNCRNFFTVLLKTSTCAFHWGCAGEVLVWRTLSSWKSSAETLLTNSLTPSVSICAGIPTFANQSLKMASATVSASLLAITVNTAYFGKASVMQRTNVFITVRCEHWTKKGSVNPKVWTIRN
jgi:hypothetical protein